MGFLDFLFGAIKKKKGGPIPPNDPVVAANQAIYQRRLPEDLTDYTICLTDYENQATFRIFKPENTWTIDFYRKYIQAYAREVRKRGGAAKIYKVHMHEYLAWLRKYQLKNCPENLEHYVEYLNSRT